MEKRYELFEKLQSQAEIVLLQSETYIQITIILAIYAIAYVVARHIRQYFALINQKLIIENHPIQTFLGKLGNLIFPLLAIVLLRIAAELSHTALSHDWIVQTALIIAVLLVFNSVVDDLVQNKIIARITKWIGSPILFLHMIGVLTSLIEILQSISISVGNIDLSLYGILRFAIFGSLLFWLGRISNSTGKDIIRRQQQLDFRTKEVASKLLEVVIFVTVSLLLLQIMGVNLTALAVFGGALGVGLGFGLQAIASNFISGIIILLDRSVSIDDYIELEDGRTGFVRELNMRSTTLETYDGKDIMVPNEKFIVESFTNWTHKNKLQRYRVDFPVAYHSDIRKLVEIIKQVVATHPQVLSGDDLPIEERPDCEIDGFGDSGINMFVEFWMEGVDDGKNRVGGDLLLMILETLQQHGYQIPFPQREVRILNPQ
ncbi:MAG: mechanosensitive ion channel [Gammaproteobacteria bacterium]|nr:mechanosensitive ion channel [Gammaproteobacteria bacterium]